MKQFLPGFLMLFLYTGFAAPLFAQDDVQPKLSSIMLNIGKPKVSDNVTENNIASLETKIESMVTESGLTSSDYNNNFIIEPKLTVTNVQKSAGGMRSVVIADCSFSLSIKQQNSGSAFSQYSKTIKGSGFNESEAITNAISQIDESDVKVQEFIAKGKQKIIDYYTQNCSVLMQKADKERMLKNYSEALSVLLTVPEEAKSCYAQAQSKAQVVFKEQQNFQCKKFLLEAQTAAANKDFDGALQTLSWIDPTGICAGEAKSLIKKIEKETTEDKRKQWQYVFKALDGSIEIGKARAAAMNNLTLYWLKNQGSKTVIVN